MGILFLSIGVYRLFYRTHYDPNLSPIDMGPYHWVIGIIFIIGGLYLVYNAAKMIIRNKRKGRPSRWFSKPIKIQWHDSDEIKGCSEIVLPFYLYISNRNHQFPDWLAIEEVGANSYAYVSCTQRENHKRNISYLNMWKEVYNLKALKFDLNRVRPRLKSNLQIFHSLGPLLWAGFPFYLFFQKGPSGTILFSVGTSPLREDESAWDGESTQRSQGRAERFHYRCSSIWKMSFALRM